MKRAIRGWFANSYETPMNGCRAISRPSLMCAGAFLLAFCAAAYFHAVGQEGDSFSFSDESTSTRSASNESTSNNAIQARSAPVTSSGAFYHTIPIQVPPGRAGMTPQLSLVYSSDAYRQDSPVGAGWSLPLPSISRSTESGFSKLERHDDVLRYSEEGAFESPSGVLVPADGSDLFPTPAGHVLYLPKREHSPVRYEYDSRGDTWVEHLPNGTKRYYGAVDARTARVVNELGTYRWLLLRERDFNGNTIEYDYDFVADERRISLITPQRVPILRRVTWGGNDRVPGRESPIFGVECTTAPFSGPIDVLHGRVLLSHHITRIDVHVAADPDSDPFAASPVWSYGLATRASDPTGRLLLTGVTWSAPGASPTTISLSYSGARPSDGGPQFGEPQPLDIPSVFEEVLASRSPFRDVIDGLDAMTPLGRRSGHHFMDVDADGDLDVAYHPAGLRTSAARWVFPQSFRQERTDTGERTFQPIHAPLGFAGIPNRLLIRSLSDIDRDLDPDALSFPVRVRRWDGEFITYYDFDETTRRPGRRVPSIVDPEGPVPDYFGWRRARREVDQPDDAAAIPGLDGASIRFDMLDLSQPPPTLSEVNWPEVDQWKSLLEGWHHTLDRWQQQQTPKGVKVWSEILTWLRTVDVWRVKVHLWTRDDQNADGMPRDMIGQMDQSLLSLQQRVKEWRKVDLNEMRRLTDEEIAALLKLPPFDVNSMFDIDIDAINSQMCAMYCCNIDFMVDCEAGLTGPMTPIPSIESRLEQSHRMRVPVQIREGLAPRDFIDIEGIRRNIPDVPRTPEAFNPLCVRLAVSFCDEHCQCTSIEIPKFRVRVAKNQSRPDVPTTQYDTPLDGWPYNVAQVVEICDEKVDWTLVGAASRLDRNLDMRTVQDFAAPVLDINADGRADIVLLKSRTFLDVGRRLPSLPNDGSCCAIDPPLPMLTSYVPRVFLSDGRDFWFDGGGWLPEDSVARELEVSRRELLGFDQVTDDSDFTHSLNEVFFGRDGRNHFPEVNNFNSWFLDVNDDGLPDLIVARPGATLDGLCDSGHEVYLNQGYRWESPRFRSWTSHSFSAPVPDGSTLADHPFTLLENRDKHVATCRPSLALPMSAMSLADINADGRVDIIFAASDMRSIASGSPVVRQYVYFNTARGFVRASDDEVLLPNDLFFGVAIDPILSAKEWHGDLARLVDVDDDGLVDIVRPGRCVSRLSPLSGLVCDEAQWQRNRGSVPDLLTRIDTSTGSWTEIRYAAAGSQEARTSGLVRDTRISPVGQMVVSHIRHAAGHEEGDWSDYHAATVQQTRLQYSNYVRTAGSRQAIGFEQVVATFLDESAQDASPFVRTSTYDVRPSIATAHGSDSSVRYPLKGQLIREEAQSGERRVREEFEYLVDDLQPGVVRIRSQAATTTVFEADGEVGSQSNQLNFDELGFARTEIAGRTGPDGVIADRESQQTDRSYVHFPDQWKVGLIQEETVSGYTETVAGGPQFGARLSHQVFEYENGRLIRSQKLIGDSGTVVGAPYAEKQHHYSDIGLIDRITENGSRTILTEFDERRLYPVTVWTVIPHDGSDTRLEEQYQYDLRFGQIQLRRDMNGGEWTTERDSQGRIVRRTGPGGVVLEESQFREGEGRPTLQTTRIFSTPDKAIQRQTTLDGDGRQLRSVDVVPPTDGGDPQYVQQFYRTYDAFGRTTRDVKAVFVAGVDDIRDGTDGGVTRFEYDGFDRMTREELPDGREIRCDFRIQPSADGVAPWRFVKTEINARGFPTRRLSNWRGELVEVEHRDLDNHVIAAYLYVRDGMGRIVRIHDADFVLTSDGDRRHIRRQLEYAPGGQLVACNLPHVEGADVGRFTFMYDRDGNVVRGTTPAGRVVDIERDILGRAIRVTNTFDGTSSIVSMEYDDVSTRSMGLMTRYVDQTGSSHISYDDFGNPARYEIALADEIAATLPASAATTYTSEYERGLLGQLMAIVVNGRGPPTRINYEQDAYGHTVSASISAGDVATQILNSAVYDEAGRLVATHLGNDDRIAWDFDGNSGFLTGVQFARDRMAFARLEFPLESYDENGNPGVERLQNADGTLRHEKRHAFDALDRLASTATTTAFDAFTHHFAYTPGGNITHAGDESYQYQNGANAHAVTTISHPGAERHLRYDADGWLAEDQTSTDGGDPPESRRLTYDGAGSLRRVDVLRGDTLNYVVEQLCGLGGRRVLRTVRDMASDTVEHVIYLPQGGELRPTEGAFRFKLSLGDVSFADVAIGLETGELLPDQSYYVHTDLRGSVISQAAFADDSGTERRQADYGPWGQRLQSENTPRLGFTGVEPDPATGYYHFGARSYDPTLRRWLSPDPLIHALPEYSASDPQELNLYAYARNNPVRRTDPAGTQSRFPRTEEEARQLFREHGVPDNSREMEVGLAEWRREIGTNDRLLEIAGEQTRADFDRWLEEFAWAPVHAATAEFGGFLLSRGAAYILPRLAATRVGEAVTTAGQAVMRRLQAPATRRLVDAASVAARSTMDDLAAAAQRAHATVGPGRGAVHGTHVHSAFATEIRGLGNANLSSEVSYLNGRVVRYGTKGSVRIDVVEGPINAPTALYDLKTGSARLTPARIRQIQQHVPGGSNVPVHEVR